MTNKQARNAIAKFESAGLVKTELADDQVIPTYTGKLADAARVIDEINERTLKLSVDYGFQTQQDVDNMKKAFAYFVPGGPEETEVGNEPNPKGSTASRTVKHLPCAAREVWTPSPCPLSG